MLTLMSQRMPQPVEMTMGEEVVDLACIGVGEATIDGLGSRARQERASHWGEAHEGGEERATGERCTR